MLEWEKLQNGLILYTSQEKGKALVEVLIL